MVLQLNVGLLSWTLSPRFIHHLDIWGWGGGWSGPKRGSMSESKAQDMPVCSQQIYFSSDLHQSPCLPFLSPLHPSLPFFYTIGCSTPLVHKPLKAMSLATSPSPAPVAGVDVARPGRALPRLSGCCCLSPGVCFARWLCPRGCTDSFVLFCSTSHIFTH